MTLINGTMMQFFHWYTPADGSLWRHAEAEAGKLADNGITALWFPPAYKCAGGPNDVGYGVYDLYDLGEFDQKGAMRTKYGHKDEYLAAIKAVQRLGMQAYADIVFNHRMGADETEWVKAVRVNRDNRAFSCGDELWIEAWTRFTFPGRNGKYSDFRWTWEQFDGVDYAHNLGAEEQGIFKFLSRGKDWAEMVSGERGNYDYLMGVDIDMNDPNVRTELARWGKWYVEETGVDGFRIDAVKHIQFSFFRVWLDYIRRAAGKEMFAVGEYWRPERVEDLHQYIAATGGRMSLFDVPLHRNFHEASTASPRNGFDMTKILFGTLVSQQPTMAVTFVDNHDTQPCQALESPVDNWFKPLAYALILLRADGYPCVFYPDYYGASYTDRNRDINLPRVGELSVLLDLRRAKAHGRQRDYFDFPNVVGWTREGLGDLPGSGLAAVMSNGNAGYKWMEVGRLNAGRTFRDALSRIDAPVKVDANGWGRFPCASESVSVWVPVDSNQ